MIPLLTVALLGLATLTVHADPVVETVHLVVTGGPNAGTWDGSEEKRRLLCRHDRPRFLGNQFSLPKEKDPAKFNSLQLIVPDAKKAASGTKNLILFRFGPLIGKNSNT